MSVRFVSLRSLNDRVMLVRFVSLRSLNGPRNAPGR